jgi:hypothetical protein
MKLEFLAAGSADCPLIRLYDFTRAEATEFLAAVTSLASEAVERIEVHRLPFVHSLSECRLTLVRRPWDQAVIRKGEPAEFECGFTAGTWENLVALVEPFAKSAEGFQWLAGTPGEATLLLSVTGEW